MPAIRTVQVAEPFSGSLRFQILANTAAGPALLLLPGLRGGRALDLIADSDLGVTAAGTELQILYEPPTGNFRVTTTDGKPVASGQAEYDEDRRAQVRIFLAADDSVHGLGGALPGMTLAPGTAELSIAPTLGRPSSLGLLLVRRGARTAPQDWLLVLAVGHAPLQIQLIRGADGRVEITYPEDREPLPVDLVFASGTLPQLLLHVQQLTGPAQLPLAAFLGAGTELDVSSPADWARRLPGLVGFDFVNLLPSYQDGPRPFTLDRSLRGTTQELFEPYRAHGRVVLLTVEPAVFVEDGNRVYQQGLDGDFFCGTESGVPFRGTGPGGDSVFPDLAREDSFRWWQKCHVELLKSGAGGFLVQSGEFCPPLENDSFRMDIKHREGSHLRLRGATPRLVAEAAAKACLETSPGVRPAVLVDAMAAGVQQWAGVLLRTAADLKSLRETVERVISMGLSGLPLAGFASAVPAKRKPFRRREFFLRRVEVGSLLPLFFLGDEERCYLEDSDAELRALARKHVRRRYRLLPYFQTLLQRYRAHGEPVLMPLHAQFPDVDPSAGSDQFMVGPHLLAAPVYVEGATSRAVYLPPGRWYEFETGRSHEGGHSLELPVEIGYYPLFVRAGSVLPLCPVRETVRESLDSGLLLEIYPAESLFGRVILDDGISRDGGTCEREFHGSVEHNGTLLLEQTALRDEYTPPFAEARYRIPGPYRYATVDGERREGVLENLMREERLLDVYSHDIPRSARRLEFHYSGSFQFS